MKFGQIASQIIDRVKRERLSYRICRQLHLLTMIPYQIYLARHKREQVSKFNSLKGKFAEIYNEVKKYNIPSQFVEPNWQEFNSKLEQKFLPDPPFSFIRDKLFASIFSFGAGGNALKKQLGFLESKLPENKLRLVLEEDYVGKPMLFSSKYLTSHNSIHHLHHLLRFSHIMKCDLEQINTVVEWGGGYGNLAKIFYRLKSTPSTYVIIDIPLVSSIQWLYLTVTLGKEAVNIVQSSDDAIEPGKINLIPLGFVDKISIKADLFLSTWALSECTKFAQDYVVSQDWFGAKHILLAYSSCSESFATSARVGEIVARAGAVIEEMGFLPGHCYAFR